MTRFVNMLVFALVASLGVASGAHALGSETALRQNFLSPAERVGDFGLQGRERLQQNLSVATTIASECCHAARGGAELTGGAARIAKFGQNWAKASLDKAVARHAGPNATSWVSETGKTIFENPATARQVVVDPAGYFRIFQPKSFGSAKGAYLDMLGNVPNPRGVQGSVLKDVRQQMTHFLFE